MSASSPIDTRAMLTRLEGRLGELRALSTRVQAHQRNLDREVPADSEDRA